MKIDVSIPTSWADLSQDKLRRVFEVMTQVHGKNRDAKFRDEKDYADQMAAQIATVLFLEWSGLKVVCPYGDGFLMRLDKVEFAVSPEVMASATSHLSWIRDIPARPVRLDNIDSAKAVAADLSENFSFDSWLTCEANWQAYQLTQDSVWLQKMAEILYDKDSIKLSEAESLSIFYWWASVKVMVSEMFPNFFHPSESESEGEFSIDVLRRNTDAQIRALTKGDITKEKEILAMDAMRALTELDAQAREYEELNRKYPKK